MKFSNMQNLKTDFLNLKISEEINNFININKIEDIFNLFENCIFCKHRLKVNVLLAFFSTGIDYKEKRINNINLKEFNSIKNNYSNIQFDTDCEKCGCRYYSYNLQFSQITFTIENYKMSVYFQPNEVELYCNNKYIDFELNNNIKYKDILDRNFKKKLDNYLLLL